MHSCNPRFVVIVAAFVCVGSASAVNIDTVAVGNPGNAGELSGVPGNYVPQRVCGAVGYVYNIGKYEITASQYTEFLNAVADADPHGLYEPGMWSNFRGCKIERSGTSGSYTYSVASDRGNRPVTQVSWGDAARFCNWLHNGQPTGPQGPSTTEDGSYSLNDATTDVQMCAIARNANATWVIPSEDEWYKAAYHKNDGVTGNYWDYATSTNSTPSNDVVNPDAGNNANFRDDGYTIDAPYYRTEAGEFENSDSPYGSFDQVGNVYEWNEAVIYGKERGLRGGAYDYFVTDTQAQWRSGASPTYQYYCNVGFRVAYVPEPGTIVMLTLATLRLMHKR
jgi:formylglycine-generating enzyme